MSRAAALLAGLAWAVSPAAAINITNCGAPIRSVVRTQTMPFVARGVIDDEYVPGANVSVQVPVGTTQCVKVRFTAKFSGNSPVIVRAFAGNTLLNPDTPFSTEPEPRGTEAFEWGSRLPAGPYPVIIRITMPGGGGVTIGPWTMAVEVTN